MKNILLSIIIPVAPEEKCDKLLSYLKKIKNLKKFSEIIIVKGNQPSFQRNEAVKKAKGKIIYFLDNDSFPNENNFEKIIKFFKTHKKAAVIGGPSLTPENTTDFSYAAGIALGSFLGSAFSSARYAQKGKLRISSEIELILCNMAFRKEVFLKAGMFNPKLYPNEENELLNRIKKLGYQIWYDPSIFVLREQRKNLKKFIKQIFNYGRGRAEQILVDLDNITLFPIISFLFDIYIIFLIIFFNPYFFLPILFYIFAVIFFSIYKILKTKRFLFQLFIIFPIIHTIYGIGFFYRIIKSIFSPLKQKENIWYKIYKV